MSSSQVATDPGRADIHPEAGITVLELLVVLAVAAMAAGLVTASLQVPNRKASSLDEIAAFVARARMDAARSGEAAVLIVTPGVMTYRDEAQTWDTSTTRVDATPTGQSGDLEQRIVIYPDGSTSGPPLTVTEGGRTGTLDMPLRPVTLHVVGQ